MTTGLQQQDLSSEFNSFYARGRGWIHEPIAVSVGVLSGLALYALATGYSIHKMINVPRVTIEKYNNFSKKIEKMRVGAPGYEAADELWTAASIAGPAGPYWLGAMFAGIGIGKLIYAAGEMRLKPIKQLEQEIEERYKGDATLSPLDAGRLVALLDREAIHHLTNKMNEDQLRAACQVLNHSTIKGD